MLASSRAASEDELATEDLLQLLRRYNFELRERAVARRLVRPPATKLRRVAKARPLHVIIRDLNDELGTQRLPRQILSGTPATLAAWLPLRTARFRLPLRPRLPRMSFDARSRDMAPETRRARGAWPSESWRRRRRARGFQNRHRARAAGNRPPSGRCPCASGTPRRRNRIRARV